MPHLHDFSANLDGKSIFSKLDIHKAYQQILVAPDHIQKTAVITTFGLFEYTAITFGLRNARKSFQRGIFPALGNFDFIFAYIDDILISSPNPVEHK